MIVFDRDAARFNFRVGAILCRAGQVLLQTAEDIDFWVVPGGRVEMLESAQQALSRELREELAVEAHIGRLLWIVESFFAFADVRFHELGMYFSAEVPDVVPEGEFDSPEPGVRLRLRWFSLDRLSEVNLKPNFLRARIGRLPATPEHVVLDELRPMGGFDRQAGG